MKRKYIKILSASIQYISLRKNGSSREVFAASSSSLIVCVVFVKIGFKEGGANGKKLTPSQLMNY